MTVIVFDVNETLIDLKGMHEPFERIFGDGNLMAQWFTLVLRRSHVATILGQTGDTDFGHVARNALDMVASLQGVNLNDSDRESVLRAMLSLPPHPEVPSALRRLKDAGYRLAALTNSSAAGAVAQLNNAGLAEYMEKIMSVQSVGKFKPAVEVYNMASTELSESPDNLWLVAAHDWDIAGAQNAGWNGAFVARPGMVVAPGVRQPEIMGNDMAQVAEKLIARLS